MLSLTFFFFFLVVLFGIIGASRGWAKEMLVSFASVLALFLLALLQEFVPIVKDMVATTEPHQKEALFWMRVGVLVLLGFFGYQTPRLPRLSELVRPRERLEDALLGFFLGALNAYLLVGSVWFFMHEANYPIPYITAPVEGTKMGEAAIRLVNMMAPGWLSIPYVYFAVAIAFVFVIVVFL